jgi:hypothetical protein
MICIIYQIGGSVRNPATRLSPLARIGKKRAAPQKARKRPAYVESLSYPEVAHHG